MSPRSLQTTGSDLGRALSRISQPPSSEMEKRRERQEIAASHYEEAEAEFGVMARDPDFDERFESFEEADPYTDDRSEEE